MKALVSAFLFLALLCSVSSATGPDICLICKSTNCSKTIIGGCMPGTRNKICYSKIIDVPWKSGNKVQKIFNQLGCMSAEYCRPFKNTATLPDGGYIYMEVKCCNKVLCNKAISVPAQENRPLNGLVCPGCLTYIPNANQSCSSNTIVNCHGRENKCISYTGRLKIRGQYYSPLSFKGCATKNLCDLLTGATEEGSDLLQPSDTTEAECSPAEYPDEEEPSPEQ
ncbi:PREDICTED: phospholipase A2 inhibitor 25 kDa subunit-like [Gekko japonicus]|uniref:Phospholipase A2 inhibitor 25 kDa subunit-like n=1 Tax=Gekko japonicus TaxID=146911 RepID=A0ABM1K4K1_GEKJA|nr:PREDICTED: phospholipase A2 inhibitor 25 kDa subunit-like [Gekko japonicus]